MKNQDGPRATHIFDEINDMQHRLTDMYNSAANQASDPNLKKGILELLIEEHEIQTDLLGVMRRRGMHIPDAASKEDILHLRETFNH